MSCSICQKYTGNFAVQPIAELNGVTLSHIASSDEAGAMKGRLVIEPIRHVVNPEDLTPDEFSNMGLLLQTAMKLLKQELNAEHVYFFRINDLVPHFHFHVVPRYANTPREFWGLKIIEWPDFPKISAIDVEKLSRKLQHSSYE